MGKLTLCLQHPTSNNIPGRAKNIQICPGALRWEQTLLFLLCERTMTVEFIAYFSARVGKSERGVVRIRTDDER